MAQHPKEVIPSRIWYYLLDFKDSKRGCKLIMDTFHSYSLHDLTLEQVLELFEIASKADMEKLKELHS